MVTSQNQFGSVDRAFACRLKGLRFDSGQGHVLWLRAHSQWWVCRRQMIDVSLSSVSKSLSLFLLSVKNKIYFKNKGDMFVVSRGKGNRNINDEKQSLINFLLLAPYWGSSPQPWGSMCP